jgi:hypothetical protein
VIDRLTRNLTTADARIESEETMTKESVINDRQILELAVLGLESERDRIDEAIRDIRSKLGIRRQPVRTGSAAVASGIARESPVRRTMSAAARRKIALAQKKRWAVAKAQTSDAERPADKPKRKLSAAGRAAIIAATKKRWAAIRKAQKARATEKAPVAKKAAPKPLAKAAA